MLQNAFLLMSHFGFHYKTILLVWIKTNKDGKILQGKGTYTAPCTELLLMGTKGLAKEYLRKEDLVS